MMDFLKRVFNFDCIGTKIKMFAAWACWIEIIVLWIASAVLSVLLFINNLEENFFLAMTAMLFPFVAALVISFVSWIGYWLMYAVGDIVESCAENLKVNYESYLTLKSIETKLTEKTVTGDDPLQEQTAK